jgi:ribosomal-protein-alanine N-acetyltransferase
MELVGPRVVLRPWRRGDEEALVRHADNRNVWRNLADRFPHPYTARDADWWIRHCAEQSTPPSHLAITLDGLPIGGIGFDRLADLARLTAEIGYWLGEAYWGRGLAPEALRLATDYAFARFDFVRLQAGVLDCNPRSRRVLEKAGYTLEARLAQSAVKDGVVIDRWLYVRLRDAAPPSSPRGR